MSGQYKDAMPKVLNDAGDMLGVILALCSHMIVLCDESAVEGQLVDRPAIFGPLCPSNLQCALYFCILLFVLCEQTE